MSSTLRADVFVLRTVVAKLCWAPGNQANAFLPVQRAWTSEKWSPVSKFCLWNFKLGLQICSACEGRGSLLGCRPQGWEQVREKVILRWSVFYSAWAWRFPDAAWPPAAVFVMGGKLLRTGPSMEAQSDQLWMGEPHSRPEQELGQHCSTWWHPSNVYQHGERCVTSNPCVCLSPHLSVWVTFGQVYNTHLPDK